MPTRGVVALLDVYGGLAERIHYAPYGDARVFANYGDANEDGVVNTLDSNVLSGAFGTTMEDENTTPGYDIRADLNADGVIDSADFNILSAHFGASSKPTAGWFSTIGNTIGYAGYVWDNALGGDTTGMYLARHRWYSPNMGRWVSRDPAGYVDGPNMYMYVSGRPLVLADPLGLWWWDADLIEWGIGGMLGFHGQAAQDAALRAFTIRADCMSECMANTLANEYLEELTFGLGSIATSIALPPCISQNQNGSFGFNPAGLTLIGGKIMEGVAAFLDWEHLLTAGDDLAADMVSRATSKALKSAGSFAISKATPIIATADFIYKTSNASVDCNAKCEGEGR